MLIPQGARLALRTCRKCGAEVSIFPGAKHQAHERAVFEVLSNAVHESVAPRDAALAVAKIEELGEESPALVLQAISACIPTLADTIAVTKPSLPAQNLTSMLLTMLRARSSVRSRSGFLRPASSADVGPMAATPAGKERDAG
jgi:hypothetical protein